MALTMVTDESGSAMKKIRLIALVGLLAASLLPGIVLAQGDVVRNTYILDSAGLEVGYPVDWETEIVSDDELGSVVVFYGDPADSGFVTGESNTLHNMIMTLMVIRDDYGFFGESFFDNDFPTVVETWFELIGAPPRALAPVTLVGQPGLRSGGMNPDTNIHVEASLAFLPGGELLIYAALIPGRPLTDEIALYDTLLAMLTQRVEGVWSAGTTVFEWEVHGVTIEYPTVWESVTSNDTVTVFSVSQEDVENYFQNGVPLTTNPIAVMFIADNLPELLGDWLTLEPAQRANYPEGVLESGVIVMNGLEFAVSHYRDVAAFREMYAASVDLPDGYQLLLFVITTETDSAAFSPIFSRMVASLQITGHGAGNLRSKLANEGNPPRTEVFLWVEGAISINHPAGWSREDLDPEVYVLLSNPADDPREVPTAPAVLIALGRGLYDLAADIDLGDFMVETVATDLGLDVTYDDLQLLEVDGFPAVRADSLSSEAGTFVSVVAIQTRTEVYMIVGVSPPADAEGFMPTFNAMLQSVELMPR